MEETRQDRSAGRKLTAPKRFRGIRKQVSAFLLTALLGFAGLVGLVAWKQGLFVQHTQIYFHAPDATGINKGMAVRLHGVPVGAIKDVELVDRGVRVRLGINSHYIPQLPRGAQARLTREGYVGAASIQILPGSTATDRTPVAEGDEIRFIAQKGMADMLDEVRQQMTPAFQELRRAATEMSDPNSDFRRSVSAMRELIEELPGATKELRQLLRDTDRSMLALGRQAESTLSILSRVGTQTEQQLPILAGKLGTTLDSLDATSKQVRETTRTNGEALRELLTQAPELMRGSGELVRDTQELTTAARRTWLLRDYIEPSEMRTLPVDSFESFGKR
ncbi:MAG TPA: MlaD family protein [Burkholderiales bacterium]|nr:MlaD family protein [Burkholderiales bacterium]